LNPIEKIHKRLDRLAATAFNYSVGLSLLIFVVGNTSIASGDISGFGLGFTQMQKLWQGLTEQQKTTTCRLASKRVYLEDQICVYVGANKTILGVYNSRGNYCATSMDCLYKPNSEKTVSGLLRDFLDKAKDDATK
jgi:hypothetical protein